ncbi:MAG: hypothetical protein A3H97_21630 [Acidobacteria bacterium RIFCSPLOWO2_02_FULL_65_29]|nr:MAG: hypothetical protein A3H97_21630 [Acidobacteria bacterium RIFCSPLOWO2_02_FULL_65_29]
MLCSRRITKSATRRSLPSLVPMPKSRILVIDDDGAIRDSLRSPADRATREVAERARAGVGPREH